MLIFRRWKIALPLLLVSIGATVLVALVAKPDYTETSYVQFIPAKITPADAVNPTTASLRNPWNQLGLNTLGQAAIYATQDQGFLDSLKAAGHTDNFTLTMTYPNPIITVEVVGSTQADALQTTQMIVDRIRLQSQSLQVNSGVQDKDIIATQRLDQGQNLVPSRSKQKRAIIAVAAAGLIVTAGGTVGIDAILRRRARKRDEEAGDTEDDSTPDTATAAASVNGKTAAPRVPDAVPLNGSVDRGAPPESVERTAIIIKRTSSVVKPSAPKQRRSPAATYRSANAQSAEAEGADEPAEKAGNDVAVKDQKPKSETNGDNSADSSDVRAVLQPKWVGGDNGGKSK